MDFYILKNRIKTAYKEGNQRFHLYISIKQRMLMPSADCDILQRADNYISCTTERRRGWGEGRGGVGQTKCHQTPGFPHVFIHIQYNQRYDNKYIFICRSNLYIRSTYSHQACVALHLDILIYRLYIDHVHALQRKRYISLRIHVKYDKYALELVLLHAYLNNVKNLCYNFFIKKFNISYL